MVKFYNVVFTTLSAAAIYSSVATELVDETDSFVQLRRELQGSTACSDPIEIEARTLTYGTLSLGQLFNHRIEKAIDVTLWSDADIVANTREDDATDSWAEVRFVKSIKDSFDFFDMSAYLRASFMGGLVKLSGSAAYIDLEKKKYEGEMYVHQIYSRRAVRQLKKELLEQFIELDDIVWKTSATHVVTSVTFGGRQTVNYKFQRTASEKYNHLSGKLEGYIKKGFIEAEAGVEINVTDFENIFYESIDMSFSTDLNTKEFPEPSLSSARQFMASFDESLQRTNGGIGVPLRAKLTPLCLFHPQAEGALLKELKDDTLNRIINTVSELFHIDDEAYELSKLAESFGMPSVQYELQVVSQLIVSFTTLHVQGKLKSILPYIRTDGAKELELDQMLGLVDNSPFSLPTMRRYLDGISDKLEMVKTHIEQVEAALKEHDTGLGFDSKGVVRASSVLDIASLPPDTQIMFLGINLGHTSSYVKALNDFITTPTGRFDPATKFYSTGIASSAMEARNTVIDIIKGGKCLNKDGHPCFVAVIDMEDWREFFEAESESFKDVRGSRAMLYSTHLPQQKLVNAQLQRCISPSDKRDETNHYKCNWDIGKIPIPDGEECGAISVFPEGGCENVCGPTGFCTKERCKGFTMEFRNHEEPDKCLTGQLDGTVTLSPCLSNDFKDWIVGNNQIQLAFDDGTPQKKCLQTVNLADLTSETYHTVDNVVRLGNCRDAGTTFTVEKPSGSEGPLIYNQIRMISAQFTETIGHNVCVVLKANGKLGLNKCDAVGVAYSLKWFEMFQLTARASSDNLQSNGRQLIIQSREEHFEHLTKYYPTPASVPQANINHYMSQYLLFTKNGLSGVMVVTDDDYTSELKNEPTIFNSRFYRHNSGVPSSQLSTYYLFSGRFFDGEVNAPECVKGGDHPFSPVGAGPCSGVDANEQLHNYKNLLARGTPNDRTCFGTRIFDVPHPEFPENEVGGTMHVPFFGPCDPSDPTPISPDYPIVHHKFFNCGSAESCKDSPCQSTSAKSTCVPSLLPDVWGVVDEKWYLCSCAPGYTGKDCTQDLDACLANPCDEGEYCEDLPAPAGNSADGRICHALSLCAKGEYMSNNPAVDPVTGGYSSDRVCQPCAEGTFQPEYGVGEGGCVEASRKSKFDCEVANDQVLAMFEPPSLFSDGICMVCPCGEGVRCPEKGHATNCYCAKPNKWVDPDFADEVAKQVCGPPHQGTETIIIIIGSVGGALLAGAALFVARRRLSSAQKTKAEGNLLQTEKESLDAGQPAAEDASAAIASATSSDEPSSRVRSNNSGMGSAKYSLADIQKLLNSGMLKPTRSSNQMLPRAESGNPRFSDL